MKFVVYHNDNASGVKPPEYYEAVNITKVYSHLISHRILDYIEKMYTTKHMIQPTKSMRDILKDPIGETKDDEEYSHYEQHKLLSEPGIDYLRYLNLDLKTLDKIHADYLQCKKEENTDKRIKLIKDLTDECVRKLSDTAIANIFYYYMTGGQGDQSGDPYSEHYDCIVQEYKDPSFKQLA